MGNPWKVEISLHFVDGTQHKPIILIMVPTIERGMQQSQYSLGD